MWKSGFIVAALAATSACGPSAPPTNASDPQTVTQAFVDEPGRAATDANGESAPQETAVAVPVSRSERVRSYAIVLGRAAGCGMDVEPYGAPVGRWISRTTSGVEESNLTVMFMGEVVAARDRQRARQTGLTCMQAIDAINETNWPR